MTPSLFDFCPEGDSSFDRIALARRLRALADQNIWVGTSSWKYEGWLDQIYSRDRYMTRGKFSKARFEAECLAEFAETFPAVCGDFSFYQFPTAEFWKKLFSIAPASLRIALKAPEEITVEVFPKQARYGPRAGSANPLYFGAAAFSNAFLDPLEPYCDRLGPVILEFGPRVTSLREFINRLDPFLAQLPKTFRYAVEIRNQEYLQSPYFDCLRKYNVAHVFNEWTRMPTIAEQMLMSGSFTADLVVVRANLRQGRTYDEAGRFEPFDKIQDENPQLRAALRDLIQGMREERMQGYIFVNNGLEGNSPLTIEAVIPDDIP